MQYEADRMYSTPMRASSGVRGTLWSSFPPFRHFDYFRCSPFFAFCWIASVFCALHLLSLCRNAKREIGGEFVFQKVAAFCAKPRRWLLSRFEADCEDRCALGRSRRRVAIRFLRLCRNSIRCRRRARAPRGLTRARISGSRASPSRRRSRWVSQSLLSVDDHESAKLTLNRLRNSQGSLLVRRVELRRDERRHVARNPSIVERSLCQET